MSRRQRQLTDLTSIQSHGLATLEPANAVLERLKIRSDGYTNMDVDRVSDLGIHWVDQDQNHRESGYFARIDGRDMPLTRHAIRGATKLALGTGDIGVWKRFPDRNAFPTTLRHILENPSTDGNRKESKSMLVRHDGISVRAIQPMSYKIKDAYDLLSDFLTMITENVSPDIQGISSIESGTGLFGDAGDFSSYRVVINENIVPTLKAQFGQYMMFLLAVSEVGAKIHMSGATAVTALGCFRTSCTNSAIREKVVTTWNHKAAGLDKFFEASGQQIRRIGYYQDQYSRIFTELAKTKLLELAPRDLLHMLKADKLITSGHFDASETYIDAQTEDGRQIETHYDMFNVLTRGAQDIESLDARQQAESRSLQLFTDPGGIMARLQKSADSRARRSGGDDEETID